MSIQTFALTPELYEYYLKIALREPPILKALREETQRTQAGANMQISAEQGQLMAFLVTLLGAKKTLDVGTFTGYSALAVGLSLPPDGKVFACDVNEKTSAIAKTFWTKAALIEKIELKLGPAIETLEGLIEHGHKDTFDFAFIDADKANYPAYYELALTLLRPGGVMAIDNIFQQGKVVDLTCHEKGTLAIRALNEKIVKDTRVTLSIIPISDGLTLVRKKERETIF